MITGSGGGVPNEISTRVATAKGRSRGLLGSLVSVMIVDQAPNFLCPWLCPYNKNSLRSIQICH